MKILFCTNVFEVVENGPVKFANLLLGINDLFPQHELRILTEDLTQPRPLVHKVHMPAFWKATPLSQFVRMRAYHKEATRLQASFPFDVLVYNNALVGLWSAYRFPNCVGMINDYKNLDRDNAHPHTVKGTLKLTVFRFLERLSINYYQKIIANSNYLARLIQVSYPKSRGKVFRLYKGVELPDSTLESEDWNELIKILFVKTDYELGGLKVLIDAIEMLSSNVELTVVGPGIAHRKRIESWCGERTNLTLRYLGQQSASAVEAELRHTNLFCVPSYMEALGVANLEAMAQGVPVVATRVGGIPEVLDGDRCGWMAPPGDAPALARALAECIGQPELRQQKLRNALDRVQLFGLESMLHNFINILKE